ncbi:TPA: hypothetical protein ACJI8J_005204 [Kluyvera georgiana]
MARKEKIHNNRTVQEKLKNFPFSELSRKYKKVLREKVQEATFLGHNKINEEDIYAILRNADELSEEKVIYHLVARREKIGGNTPDSKSTREKYKRICTIISQAFETLIQEEEEVNGLKAIAKGLKRKAQLNEMQKQKHIQMLNDGASIEELIKHLKGLLP